MCSKSFSHGFFGVCFDELHGLVGVASIRVICITLFVPITLHSSTYKHTLTWVPHVYLSVAGPVKAILLVVQLDLNHDGNARIISRRIFMTSRVPSLDASAHQPLVFPAIPPPHLTLLESWNDGSVIRLSFLGLLMGLGQTWSKSFFALDAKIHDRGSRVPASHRPSPCQATRKLLHPCCLALELRELGGGFELSELFRLCTGKWAELSQALYV